MAKVPLLKKRIYAIYTNRKGKLLIENYGTIKDNIINEIYLILRILAHQVHIISGKTLYKQTRVARGSVPSMVYDNHDNMFLTSDEDVVHDKWKNYFSSLYNAALISPHDEQYTQLINMKEDVEYNMSQNYYSNNNYLNSNISYDEVEKCIGRLKPHKAAGYDGICTEVLCKPQSIYVLYKLFSRIFESGKIPPLWKRCNITPVPESAMKDPHVPINYRGISLLCIRPY